jgi:hypothetical protein
MATTRYGASTGRSSVEWYARGNCPIASVCRRDDLSPSPLFCAGDMGVRGMWNGTDGTSHGREGTVDVRRSGLPRHARNGSTFGPPAKAKQAHEKRDHPLRATFGSRRVAERQGLFPDDRRRIHRHLQTLSKPPFSGSSGYHGVPCTRCADSETEARSATADPS